MSRRPPPPAPTPVTIVGLPAPDPAEAKVAAETETETGDLRSEAPTLPDGGGTLAERLIEPTYWDHAAYALGQVLGAIDRQTSFAAARPLLWADGPLGEGLIEALLVLTKLGFLDHHNQHFQWIAPVVARADDPAAAVTLALTPDMSPDKSGA
jgi:hypothetical protein